MRVLTTCDRAALHATSTPAHYRYTASPPVRTPVGHCCCAPSPASSLPLWIAVLLHSLLRLTYPGHRTSSSRRPGRFAYRRFASLNCCADGLFFWRSLVLSIKRPFLPVLNLSTSHAARFWLLSPNSLFIRFFLKTHCLRLEVATCRLVLFLCNAVSVVLFFFHHRTPLYLSTSTRHLCYILTAAFCNQLRWFWLA